MIGQKAHINHLESQSPCTETLFENLMDLEGVREALLGLTGRRYLFNMEDLEAVHSKKRNKRIRSR